MERLGVDAVVAEGTESGGHVGELTTMALVPSVREAGFHSRHRRWRHRRWSRGICAAFALGAEGVQMGTRFLTIDECTGARSVEGEGARRQGLRHDRDGRGTGHPVRGLKNKFARACRKREMEAQLHDLEGMYAGSLKRAVEGDMENGSILAGQVAALVKKRGTAKELIAELMAEAEALGALDLAAMAELNARQGRCLEDADA